LIQEETMGFRQLTGSLVLGGGVLLMSMSAPASQFEPVRDAQLVCEATDVVRGQVTDVQSAWDKDRVAIWTTATVQVEDVIRGNAARGARFQVKEVGGTVAGYTITAEGFPTFRKGEEVVLLLKPWEDGSGAHRVWGYGRGMFVVGRREGGEPTASRHDVVESGRATMFTDRIPPTVVLGTLIRELGALARRCGPGGPPE
jgi:hypothetical protein